jgi:hypothetical protein
VRLTDLISLPLNCLYRFLRYLCIRHAICMRLRQKSKVFSRNGMMGGWFVNNIDIQLCCCRRIFATLTRYTSRISHLVKSESQYVLITFYLSGSYKSCGNSYTITEAKTIELEPLMSKNYHPWDTITRPDLLIPATLKIHVVRLTDLISLPLNCLYRFLRYLCIRHAICMRLRQK